MTVKCNASLIKKIDHENKVIHFEQNKFRKITGSRLSTVIGRNEYETPFSAACEMAGIYSEYESTIFTEAGNILEPVIRSHLRANTRELLGKQFGLKDDDIIGVEEPIASVLCGYDHFPNEDKFGGLVDGYILINGKRVAILEIKTASKEEKWIDEFGTRNRVPISYALQASLYARLSGLNRIVFVAGFLRDGHYKDPSSWTPCNDNCVAIVTDGMPDISESMKIADAWYDEHMTGGVTPQWDEDNKDDLKVVDTLTKALQNPPKKDLQELMKEYIRIDKEISEYDETKKILSEKKKAQDSVKEEIRSHMTNMFANGQKKVILEEDGHSFTLSVTEGMKIDEEKLKNDGIYDKYAERTTSYRFTFK
jgi:hypothetical protein